MLWPDFLISAQPCRGRACAIAFTGDKTKKRSQLMSDFACWPSEWSVEYSGLEPLTSTLPVLRSTR